MGLVVAVEFICQWLLLLLLSCLSVVVTCFCGVGCHWLLPWRWLSLVVTMGLVVAVKFVVTGCCYLP